MTIRKSLSFSKLFLLVALFLFAAEPSTSSEAVPTVQGDGTLRRIHAPILMYHYVSELPADADEIRTNLTVTPAIFQQQMEYLAAEGYTPLSLYEIDQALRWGMPLPENPVVLTFDDGHIDHYTHVFPVLQEFGFTGTFFIITDFADANRPQYLNWQQIQEMAQAGMHMESHTKSHVDLRNRTYDFLVYEILGSIESLQHHIQRPIGIFAYPAGRYDNTTLQILQTTPILRAVTTQPGTRLTTDNTLELPRMRVTNDVGVAGLPYLLNYQP